MRKPYRFSMMWISCVCISFYSYAQVEEAWVRRYVTDANEVPVAVKTNGSAVYVLGQTNQFTNSADLILIKYNSAGTFQWSQTYNSPGNDEDKAVAMTLDAAGNIYVVGRGRLEIGTTSTGQTVTLKYNSAGVLLWSAIKLRPDILPCEPNDVAVDATGNVYVTGSTIEGAPFAYDFMTIKYNSSGVEQWTRNYNGTANSLDFRTHIAIDASGNIYVTGESQGILKKGLKVAIQTFADVYTIKYNPNGGVMWQRRYDSPFHSGDRPNSIALDNAGNVYITGSSNTDPNHLDYLTMKLNGGDGKILYTARYNGTANGNDAANGIVVNAAGEAFVTGLSDPYGNNNAFNYVTVKYNSTGAEVWTASYNGPADGTDIANAIRMDGFGFIYVTGESQGDSYDFATVQYGNTGIEPWRVRYDGAFLSDKAIDMAVFTPPGPAFEQAHVYVVGESEGVGSGLDIALVKYEQPLVIGEFDRTSGLSNYPNPFTGITTIEYSLNYDSDVSIRIIDPFTSKEVRNIAIGERSAGKHNHAFSAEGLKPGNYIYKIDAQSKNGKFTEARVMQIDNK